MMPRIDYAFFGRYLEKYDNGYSTYYGYLFIEAAHTHPILLSFCSLLHYKILAFENPNFHLNTGRVVSKVYNKRVLRKWYLYCTLVKNPSLIAYRKRCLQF